MALKGFLKRVTGNPDQLERHELERFATLRSETTTSVRDLVPRAEATVGGEIASLRVVPARDGSSWLEAVVDDGTGSLLVVWTGRRSIPGIREGARLLVSGRPSLAGRSGRPTLYNPAYELLA